MEWMGSCDGTSEYSSVCDATDGYVRCDDVGEVVRLKLFLGHFERHTFPDLMNCHATSTHLQMFYVPAYF